MGGQACVFYGAAQFSRDLDLLILTDPESISLIRSASEGLQAQVIAVPSFDPALLDRGHAVHTPELLVQLAALHPETARQFASRRPAVAAALQGDLEKVSDALDLEQREERRKDRAYWEPLKRELEEFRRSRARMR